MGSVINSSACGRRDTESIRVQIPGDSEAAGRARAEMGRLRSDLDAPLLENVRLLVTELITNAVRHAHAEAVELVMVVSRTRVHVEVGNPGAGFEPRPSGPEDSDKGWGLFLVDRLSSDWGVAQESGTDYQRVWFVMARTA